MCWSDSCSSRTMYEPIGENSSKSSTTILSTNNSCTVVYLFLLVAVVCLWYVYVIIQGDFSPNLGSGQPLEGDINVDNGIDHADKVD